MAKQKSEIAKLAGMELTEARKDLKAAKAKIKVSTGAEKKKLIADARKIAEQVETLKLQAKG